jgi:aspartate carbamoyltransferase catalytic subunit
MSETALRGPDPSLRSIEHPVADVANATRLAAAIPHNGYFAQARGAKFVRMALFCSIMGKLAA